MCLYAEQEKIKGDPAPTATRAWKVVTHGRRAFHRDEYALPYVDGSEHIAEEAEIMRWREICAPDCRVCVPKYHYGLHVYETRPYGSLPLYPTIEVEVDPADWIASGNGEAVYRKLKVIGEVA
jgi:hypothetical protein